METNSDGKVTLEKDELERIVSLLALQYRMAVSNNELKKSLSFWKAGAIINLISALLLLFMR